MPWRNGLGSTVEIARQELEDGGGFAWRLSMADVTQDGEFSNFSGYDRTLLLLEGNGLTLDCGDTVERLEQHLQAARFRGEAATFASLHDGSIKDFNIMALRRLCSADVTSQSEPDEAQIDVDADLLLVFAVGADLSLASRDTGETLLPKDHLLMIEQPARQTLHCSGAGFIITQISYTAQIP